MCISWGAAKPFSKLADISFVQMKILRHIANNVFSDGHVTVPHCDGKSLYDFSVRNSDGVIESLSKYKGNVVLVVNVASE